MATIKSIKEKAKRYDEALVRANEMIKDMTNIGGVAKVDDIQYIFPELKESEDEKIRKRIISALVEWNEKCSFPGDSDDMIAWLEKQGEQKPEGKSALEAINEEKVDNANKVEPRQEKLTEFEKAVKQVMEEAIECGDTHNLKADAEMLLSLEHNSSWSEEDEKLLDKVIKRLHKYSAEDEEYLDKYYWLIELKHRVQPQSTWKPSDEQMERLYDVVYEARYKNDISENGYSAYKPLNSLYLDLKKLKG